MTQPYPVEQLVKEWMAWAAWTTSQKNPEDPNPFGVAFFELGWLVEYDPEAAWNVILRIFDEPTATPFHGHLAAGPIEDLLSNHGSRFIDRVEAKAAQSQQFASLLGGVWQHTMPSSIWQRVQVAAGSSVASRAG